jgi:transcriptional regulator GlxA family with amidase domain
VFRDVEELDFVGPWEVFTASAALREQPGEAPDRAVLVAAGSQPIRCSKGLRIIPETTFDSHPPLDFVLVPGGLGIRREAENPQLLAWLAKVAEPADWVTSVCTGIDRRATVGQRCNGSGWEAAGNASRVATLPSSGGA